MGIVRKPPPPYCTPQMLAVLRNIEAGRNFADGVPGGVKPGTVAGICSALKSRGWVAYGNVITPAGRAYLASQAAP